MHSAAWNHAVDFDGKTVAVIGNGSTSVQIVPQLQKTVEKLKVFMRSPTWISPQFGAGALQTDLRKGMIGFIWFNKLSNFSRSQY